MPKKKRSANYAPPRPAVLDTSKRRLTWTPRPRHAHLLLLLLLYAFCTLVWGDVFVRAEQESFVNADATAMKFVIDQPWGHLYWALRWGLVVFKSRWIGGLVLTALLYAMARLTDSILRLPAQWSGVSSIVPFGMLGWFVYKGLNLYVNAEPSHLLLWPLLACLVLGVVAIAVRLFLHRTPRATMPRSNWKGILVLLAAFCALTASALTFRQNAILTARMQLRLQKQDWEGMIADGLSARRPSKPVAAYYAIGLLREGRLLDGLFDIPYDYPVSEITPRDDANEDYRLINMDCDFEAGLVQTAYRDGMEYIVVNGPILYRYKRMAICAIMMREKELAEKYLRLIETTPFEQAFVEKYRPMAEDFALIDADAELNAVQQLFPREEKFEQYYRKPVFMGYNMGLESGSDETLITSVATCLYSKDIPALAMRADIMSRKGMPLPRIVQEALVCGSIKHPQIGKAFPLPDYMRNSLQSFLIEAKQFNKDKDKRRQGMKKNWLGTYLYYYYCENNDSTATGQSEQGNGVN